MTTAPYYVYDLLQGNGYRWNYGPIGGSGNPDGTPATITYAFQTSGTTPTGDTVVALSSAQQAAVQLAFSYIEQFANITFVQTSSVSSADITFGFDETNTGASGEAGITYWNTTLGVLTQANIYLDNVATNQDLSPGSLTTASVADGAPNSGFGWLTLLHEIGHALGLKHPFDENAAGDPASVLDTDYPSEDTHLYSVMSYTEAQDSGFLDTSAQLIYNLEPLSYGMFDVAALQYLYGANNSPSLAVLQSIFGADGDTVTGAPGAFTYTFSPNVADYETIADGGTHDTLNFASFTAACTIDLSPGTFSSLGTNVNVDPGNLIFPAPPSPFAPYDGVDALAIAFGTTVTTCIGGAGNDTLIGNSANDFLEGGPGVNTIEGGSGINTAVYAGPRADYRIVKSNGAVIVVGNGSDDTLTHIQYLQFANETIPAWPVVSDFTGAGTSDILWQAGGTGALDAAVLSTGVVRTFDSLGTPTAGWTLVGTADLSGSGTSDVLWQNASTGALGAYVISNGLVTGWDALGTPTAGWSIVGIGDFDGTGSDDILWQNASTGALGAYVISDGAVTGWDSLGTPTPGWNLVGIGDFTGGGSITADILWQNATTGALGADVISDGQVTGWDALGTPTAGWSVVGIGDFNGTGTDDILWQNASTGAVGAYVMSNGQITGWDTLTTPGAGWSIAGTGDFTGDGSDDILWRNTITGAAGVSVVSGGQVTGWDSLGAPGTGWSAVGSSASGLASPAPTPRAPLGDLTGTGTTDIVWLNGAGALGAFVMSNGQVGATDTLATPTAGWNLIGLGAFNGSGSDGILWQNATTGEVGAYVVSNGQVTGWDSLGTPSAGWNIVGIGDFNGTGTDGILWQNTTTGALGAYVISNGQVTGWDSLGTPSAGWTLKGVGDFNGTGTDGILWQNASTGAVGADVISNGAGHRLGQPGDAECGLEHRRDRRLQRHRHRRHPVAERCDRRGRRLRDQQRPGHRLGQFRHRPERLPARRGRRL